jgi:hypothetical protein
MASASIARLVRMCGAIAYPINSLLHKSITVARYTQPSDVRKHEMSPVSFSPGIGAVSCRPIRSGTAAAALSGFARLRRLRRVVPRRPFSRMSLATINGSAASRRISFSARSSAISRATGPTRHAAQQQRRIDHGDAGRRKWTATVPPGTPSR